MEHTDRQRQRGDQIENMILDISSKATSIAPRYSVVERGGINVEFNDQVQRDTFKITKAPYDVHPIGGKWVYYHDGLIRIELSYDAMNARSRSGAS